MASIDKYAEDLERCKGIHAKIQGLLKERKQAETAGKSTATVDYKLKAESGKLTKECINLDKLVYEYENNVAKYESIAEGTKKKRMKELKPLLDQWKKSVEEIKAIFEAKTMAQAPASLDMNQEIQDLESNTKYARTVELCAK